MANYDDEFVLHAWVKDDTATFFDRFDRFADNYRAKADTAFNATSSGAAKSTAALGALAGGVAGITMKLLDMALAAASAFGKFAKDSVELAARVETLGVNVYRIGEKMGYSKQRTDEVVESLKDMGITTQGAYNSLLLLARANIDWSEATDLARVAQDSAVIAGINSTEAFERLARGIQKMEPELLDELGITINRTRANEAYAATIGTTAKLLDDAGRRQAFLNDIYRQSGVVAGAYTASMETAGKQAASLARHVEELQLAIGEAFQPLYKAKIEFMTDALKQLRSFVEANEDELKKFGQLLGDNLSRGLTAMLKLLELTLKLANGMVELNKRTQEWTRSLVGDENVTKFQKWWSGVVVTAGQAISLIVGVINAAMTGLADVAEYGAVMVKGAVDVLKGDIGVDDYIRQVGAAFEKLTPQKMGDTLKAALEEGTVATAKFLGLIEDADAATASAGATAEEAATGVDKLSDSMKDATKAAEEASPAVDNLARAQEALASIQKSNARSEADRMRQEHRQALEDAIQQSRQRLEIERRYQEQIASIRENADKQRQNLASQYQQGTLDAASDLAEERVAIEQDYHDRLEQIRRDFLYNSEELARNRDAIGMTRLIRENKKQLQEEEIARKQSVAAAEQNYAKRIEELQANYVEQQRLLEESIAQQMAAAELARQEEYLAMERALNEERELKQLHDRWAAEDRRIALQRQLQDWMEQYSSLEGVTTAGLNKMLGSWRSYLSNVTSEASNGLRRVQDMLRPLYDAQVPTGSSSSGGSSTTTTPGGITVIRMGTGQRVTGQGGQISQKLASGMMPSVMDDLSFQSVTPTRPQSSTDKREIRVTVDGNALDPYMQQVVVNTLTEIERNRG